MKTIDIFKLSFLGITRKPIRSFLTIIGVIIGISCIIVMVSISLSGLKQFNEEFAKDVTMRQIRVYGENKKINQNIINEFKKIEGVKTTSGIIDMPLVIKYKNYYSNVSAIAIDKTVLEENNIIGHIFESETIPELIVGSRVLNDIFKFTNDDNLSDIINTLTNEDFDLYFGYGNNNNNINVDKKNSTISNKYKSRVCGIINTNELDETSYNVYINLKIAKRLINNNKKLSTNINIDLNNYNSAVIIANTMDYVKPISNALQKMGYVPNSSLEYVETIQLEKKRQQKQLAIIASISLLISSIGIANSMITNISERKREIGIMKVIGLNIKKIRIIFIIESSFIGLIGGIIGSFVSYMVIFIINNSNSTEVSILGIDFINNIQLSIPIWIVFLSIIISVLIGIISGLYPAVIATKISPIEAIKN